MKGLLTYFKLLEYVCTVVLVVAILAHVCGSKNVGYHSAQVLRIANQCPVMFGFQNVGASVIELYLVGSEVLYIKRVFVVHSQAHKVGADRFCACVCMHACPCMCLCRRDRQVYLQLVLI